MIRPHDIAPFPLPQVRRVTPLDIPAIVEIEKEGFSDPWDQQVLVEALTYFPTTYFVAISEGRVAGFIIGAMEDTGENIYGHIANLAVSRQYRNRGIGRLLVSRLEHQCILELGTGIQLEVRVSNTAAQRFYRTLGYHDLFIIDRYYANGEDAIVMTKWFRF